jgi:hypothetical protein
LPDTRMTVTFTAKGLDPRGDISTILAFEK